MAEELENPTDDVVSADKKSGSSSKNPLVTLVLILNLIAMGTIAYFQYTHMKSEAEKPSVRELVQQEILESGGAEARNELAVVQEQQGPILPLDGFTVNLAQGDGPRRFVRLNAVLKFSKDSKQDEFAARKPQIRDTIISILNSKRPEDLLKREGKNYLKEEIKAAINSYLVDGEVVDIYYVGFQIN